MKRVKKLNLKYIVLGVHCPVNWDSLTEKGKKDVEAIVDYLPLRRGLARVTPGSQEPVTEVNYRALRA